MLVVSLFLSLMVATTNCQDEHQHFVAVLLPNFGRWSDEAAVMPHNKTLTYLSEAVHPEVAKHHVTAESSWDLTALYEMLSDLNDGSSSSSHRFVVTPLFAVSGFNETGMRALGCPDSDQCAYVEQWLHTSQGGLYNFPFYRGDLREQYLQGLKQGLWHPELAGRSLISPSRWMECLKKDRIAQEFFHNGIAYCGHTDISENWDELEDLQEWLQPATESFEQLWGYRPRVIWSKGSADAGHVLHELGLEPVALSGPISMVNAKLAKLEEIEEAVIREKFLFVRWGAHWMMSGTRGAVKAAAARDAMKQLVDRIRTKAPKTVFVTANELVQLKKKGWSVEHWNDKLVARNIRKSPVEIVVPRHVVVDCKEILEEGSKWTLEPQSIVELWYEESSDCKQASPQQTASKQAYAPQQTASKQADAPQQTASKQADAPQQTASKQASSSSPPGRKMIAFPPPPTNMFKFPSALWELTPSPDSGTVAVEGAPGEGHAPEWDVVSVAPSIVQLNKEVEILVKTASTAVIPSVQCVFWGYGEDMSVAVDAMELSSSLYSCNVPVRIAPGVISVVLQSNGDGSMRSQHAGQLLYRWEHTEVTPVRICIGCGEHPLTGWSNFDHRRQVRPALNVQQKTSSSLLPSWPVLKADVAKDGLTFAKNGEIVAISIAPQENVLKIVDVAVDVIRAGCDIRVLCSSEAEALQVRHKFEENHFTTFNSTLWPNPNNDPNQPLWLVQARKPVTTQQ